MLDYLGWAATAVLDDGAVAAGPHPGPQRGIRCERNRVRAIALEKTDVQVETRMFLDSIQSREVRYRLPRIPTYASCNPLASPADDGFGETDG